MPHDDTVLLRHMRDAAVQAVDFVRGRAAADLERDAQLLLALVKCLEIVGEAAGKISDTTRNAIPGIPWRAVIGMRNRLIHAYFDINRSIVWQTVRSDLPPMIAAIDSHLGDVAR